MRKRGIWGKEEYEEAHEKVTRERVAGKEVSDWQSSRNCNWLRNLVNNTQEHTIVYNEWQYTHRRCRCEQWNPVYITKVKAGLWVTINRGTLLYIWVTIQNCTSCTDGQGKRNDDDELIMTIMVTLVMMMPYREFLRSTQVARKSSRGYIYTFAS